MFGDKFDPINLKCDRGLAETKNLKALISVVEQNDIAELHCVSPLEK